MTKQRAPRVARSHRGVKLLRLAGGRFVARFRDPITRKVRQVDLAPLGLTNAQQRLAWAKAKAGELAETKRQLSLGLANAVRSTVADAVAAHVAASQTPATRSNRNVALRAFAEWCAARGLETMDRLTQLDAIAWHDHLHRPDNPHAISSRNQWSRIMSAFFTWARKRGLVPLLTPEAIAAGTARVAEPGKEVEFLRPAQLRELLSACLHADATARRPRLDSGPIVLLLLLTGCRVNELATLQWRDVDLVAGEIRLRPEAVKTRRTRTIGLRESPALAQLLQALRDRTEAERGAVQPTDLVHPIAQSARRQQRLTEGPALSWTPHTLRRTCGTLLTCAPGIFGGASAYLSAKRLGHSVRVAEKLYAGVLPSLPPSANTIEAAAGIEDLAAAIVEAVRKKR